jgi:DNA processing protein
LREVYDPPIILYIKGLRWVPDLPQVAVVGTRRPTGYGLNCAERFAEDLAGRGVAVTSGLARGIDAAAHRGALRTGVTYAVFGSGLDFVYPKENRKLAEARLALESNREVFAVPGNITSPNSFGPHILIRQGAKLTTGWQDVVEELPHPIRERVLLPLIARMESAPQPQLAGAEKKIWDLLSLQEAVAIDSLLSKLALGASDIYSALLSLETQNLIRQLPGNKYLRRL